MRAALSIAIFFAIAVLAFAAPWSGELFGSHSSESHEHSDERFYPGPGFGYGNYGSYYPQYG